ncbi:hypothetical protein DFH11DRAFT_1502574 [Phellopilus nigrolimitatus]|nr:hypothetical protein DFH11DRAFT_1502574 [Phellopilus nigrolimitatus]
MAGAPKSNKRKSDAGATASSSKKTKTDDAAYASAKDHVKSILADPESFDIESDEANVRRVFVELAEYASSLEADVKSLVQESTKPSPPAKTPEKIESEADRLGNTIVSGIKKQMSWKPSCKTNSSKFVFDGFCPDPLVFGKVLGLDGPPKFKQKKIPRQEFEDFVGSIEGSARYNTLYISSSEVNVRYNADTGEFKVSGSYGITHG